MIEPHNHPYLPVSKGNLLDCTDKKRSELRGMDKEDDYYDEINQNGDIVAKYHVWYYLNMYPPQKVSEGWEKFDLEGNVVASGSTK